MRFLAFFFLLFPILANAGAYSVVRQQPVITSGVSNGQAIVQVAQPMTFTQGAAANQSITFDNAANAAQYSLGNGSAGTPAMSIAQAALGFAGAGAAFVTSPIVGGVLATVGVGMAGYQLYKSFVDAGISTNSSGGIIQSGTPNYLSPPDQSAFDYYCHLYNPQGSCFLNAQGQQIAVWADGSQHLTGITFTPSPTPSVPSKPLTADEFRTILTQVLSDPSIAADATNFALSQGINPLQYLSPTQPNLNPNPWAVTLPDGTTVTVSPALNPAAQPALNPAPTSTVDVPISQPKPQTAPQTTNTADPATTQAIRDQIAADAARKAAEDATNKTAFDAVKMPTDIPKFSDINLPTSNPFTHPDLVIPLPSSNGCVPLNVSLPYLGNLVITPCDIVAQVQPLLNWMVIILGVIGGLLVWLRSEGEPA